MEKYFKLAKNASTFSDFPRVKIGAILVYKGKVVSVGWNTVKENPLQKKYNQLRGFNTEIHPNSLHAEMMCLLRAKHLDIDFRKASMFIYRNLKNGSLGISRPCPACMKAIQDFDIKNIYYTTGGGFVHEIIEA